MKHFEEYHEVDLLGFKKYIKSIGFELKSDYNFIYEYKQYIIYLFPFDEIYDFFNGSEWINDTKLNDLTQFRKIERSSKIKKLLDYDR